jgi:hypothetical protein
MPRHKLTSFSEACRIPLHLDTAPRVPALTSLTAILTATPLPHNFTPCTDTVYVTCSLRSFALDGVLQ